MKKIILVLVLAICFSACKKDVKNTEPEVGADGPEKTTKQNDGLTLLKGEFIYYGDAAVLQTHNDVYGVVINDKMHELDKLAKKHKKEVTDMVPVAIRGKIIPKPENEEGWPFRIEIKEILEVSKPTPESNDVIKLGSK